MLDLGLGRTDDGRPGSAVLGIKVQDGVPERGGLCFDLTEILTALGRSALESCRLARGVSYVADQDVALLEEAEGGTRVVSGAELLVASRHLLQVIDGEFFASRTPGAPP